MSALRSDRAVNHIPLNTLGSLAQPKSHVKRSLKSASDVLYESQEKKLCAPATTAVIKYGIVRFKPPSQGTGESCTQRHPRIVHHPPVSLSLPSSTTVRDVIRRGNSVPAALLLDVKRCTVLLDSVGKPSPSLLHCCTRQPPG